MSKQARINIIAILGVVVLAWFMTRPTLPAPQVLERALAKTESAFSRIEVRGDVAFWVGQGARLANRDVRLSLVGSVRRNRYSGMNQFDFVFWELRDRDLPAAPDLEIGKDDTIDDTALLDASDMSSPDRSKQAIKIVTQSMDCRRGSPVTALMAKPGYGYISTHQLLGLLIAVELGCLETSEFAERARPFISRVYTEMIEYEGPLTDLQVERAALLGIVGQVDLIPIKLINDVLSRQKDDGLWYFGESDKPPLNVASHNAAVSYTLLAAVLGSIANT